MKAAEEIGTLCRVATARMPTKWGMFNAAGFARQARNGTQPRDTALAMVMGDLKREAPLLRIHSQCFTGEGLGSLRCDCSDQLSMAMRAIAAEGHGLVIYEYQEGRGIGLMAKLQAYELQDSGIDTVEANHVLGFRADCRDYSLPVAILRELSVHRVRLLTNNPDKVRAMEKEGLKIAERVPMIPRSWKKKKDGDTGERKAGATMVGGDAVHGEDLEKYLRTKVLRMGHMLQLNP